MRTAGRLALLLAVALVLGSCDEQATGPGPKNRVKELYHLNKFEEAFGFAQAVRVENTIYISGSVAVDADGKLIGPDDMALQLRASYDNVRGTLKAFKTDFDHVVKETIYTTDMDALLRESKLRFEYYDKQNLPAATWVQVQRLVDPGFLVAIDVTVELP
jgi:enamine deaminase RidA (YjgF/YER057c/UK114 family)